jgi:hypothetical protein
LWPHILPQHELSIKFLPSSHAHIHLAILQANHWPNAKLCELRTICESTCKSLEGDISHYLLWEPMFSTLFIYKVLGYLQFIMESICSCATRKRLHFNGFPLGCDYNILTLGTYACFLGFMNHVKLANSLWQGSHWQLVKQLAHK